MPRILIAVPVLLTLVACAGPTILSDTPDGVTLKYDPMLTSRNEAKTKALEVCQRYDKRASLIREGRDDPLGIGAVIANYECE